MRRLPLLGTAISVFALATASVISLPKKLVYNASASAPIGFYWIDQERVSRGDYVFVRLPERVRKLVEERRYLPPDVPLIKRLVGLTGDEICRREQEILINGITVAVAQRSDNLGRELPEWQGCHVLTKDNVFLLQNHPQSLDSRYFGPVDRGLIIGRATRLRFPWRKREQG
jgi:conjugative transfer signal peptidase TraF